MNGSDATRLKKTVTMDIIYVGEMYMDSVYAVSPYIRGTIH